RDDRRVDDIGAVIDAVGDAVDVGVVVLGRAIRRRAVAHFRLAVPGGGAVGVARAGGQRRIAADVHDFDAGAVEITGVAHSVPVGVLLAGVGEGYAVVAQVTDTVEIAVRLPGVVDQRTVVIGADTVAVQVVEQVFPRLTVTVAVAGRVEVVDDELLVGARLGEDVVGRVGDPGDGDVGPEQAGLSRHRRQRVPIGVRLQDG